MASTAAAPDEVPRVMHLAVDATETAHKVFRVRQRLPLPGDDRDGPVTLMYPQWQLASHAPTIAAGRLAGLEVWACRTSAVCDQRLDWQRDAVDMHAIHIQPPPGTRELALSFVYLSPRAGNVAMGRHIVNVGWAPLVLYPAGVAANRVAVAARVKLPTGMSFAIGLQGAVQQGDEVTLPTVPLDVLVDSPLVAGHHLRRWALSDRPTAPVHLSLFANRPEDLALSDEQLAAYRDVVVQVQSLFGNWRREPYEFLMVLDENMGGPGGIEHRRSTELFLPANLHTEPEGQLRNLDLMAHEYIHAWNGTQFMPTGMASPHFNQPLRAEMMWVYEGLTQYWGKVIAARAGLRTRQEALDDLALDAAQAQTRASRAWKPIDDSGHDPINISGRGIEWPDLTGKKDYYTDGPLLWLAVDLEIRARTGQRKSLDDFAKLFFRADVPGAGPVTYNEADLYAALNAVAPADWPAFFRARLQARDGEALLTGLAQGGYRLVYDDEPTETFEQDAQSRGVDDFIHSLGLAAAPNGVLRFVRWNGPAFRAGLSAGARLTKVNGEAYSAQVLRTALVQSPAGTLRVDALVDGESVATTIAYTGGLRYPKLERIRPDAPLDDIFRRHRVIRLPGPSNPG